MSTQNNERTLPLRVKLGVPLCNVGSTTQMLLQMYFLLFFYTNVLGISGTAAGIIVMVARIWDFINDPLMGVLVEKTRRPEKCLFLMRLALIPAGIFMVLCYTAPNLSYNMKLVWAAATFVCFGMAQTAYGIPKSTLEPKLTSSKTERSKLNIYSQVFSTILNALVPAVTFPLLGALSGLGESRAFTALAAIYALVYILCGFAGIAMCKGYEYDDEEDLQDKSKLKTSDLLSALLQNKVALVVLLMQTIKMLLSSVGTSVLSYFCIYNLGNANAMSIASSITPFSGLLPVLFLVPLYKKFGNAGTGILGCAVAVGAYLAMVVTHVSSANLYIVLYVIAYAGISLASAVIPLCLMDSIDYGEWKTGKKNISIIMSASGIGTKIGLAFGTSIAGFVVGAVNFDPNAATQPDNVLNAFFHLSVTSQLVVYASIVMLMVYLSRIERKLPQMREEIAWRRASAN